MTLFLNAPNFQKFFIYISEKKKERRILVRDLIKKVQSGDELAFKQLTATIENDLYKIARTRLNNYEDIKDAVQNTMIIIY